MRVFSVPSLSLSLALSASAAPTKRDETVDLDGRSFVNKGLVAFGLIPHDALDAAGDTLGGFGSAISIAPGSFKKTDSSFEGTLIAHPDRGFNVETTIDYQARQHEISFTLSPYYDSDQLSFKDAQKTLQLTYKGTVFQKDREGTNTTGLDSQAIRPAAASDPQLPIASKDYDRLTLDVEGLVANEDGTFWISDESGPYIYKFSAEGNMLQAIAPPDAILPKEKNGNVNFTSSEDPLITATGRSPNQGFEGLTIDTATNTLYAMLQTATLQDGGPDKATNRYTRLLAYNVGSEPAELIGEYVVPLPQSKKGNSRASSEIHFVGDGIFFALARDGDGRSSDETESSYKQADLFSISGATDIHGTKYDSPENPISPGGKLEDGITPAEYVSFVDYLDKDGLDRFSLHNGGDDDETLINAKWESLAVVPALDDENPDDYFLITVSDNDYITTKGVMLGVPYDAGLDIDNQVFVFRVTLPGFPAVKR